MSAAERRLETLLSHLSASDAQLMQAQPTAASEKSDDDVVVIR